MVDKIKTLNEKWAFQKKCEMMYIVICHLQQNHVYCNVDMPRVLVLVPTAETSEALVVHEDRLHWKKLVFISLSQH